MMWLKLCELRQGFIYRGAVIRFPSMGATPELTKELMFYEPLEEEKSLGLITIAGQKSGLVLVNLPSEAGCIHQRAIRTSWVIENWSRWIWPECEVSKVWIAPNGHPVPKGVSR